MNGLFSGFLNLNINNNNSNGNSLFKDLNINNNNQEDDGNFIKVNFDDEKLSQIKESVNESGSETESLFKSRKDSQNRLSDNNINNNEDKKDNEFLRPYDVSKINKVETINNNEQGDFEDFVNCQFCLFPIP